ncbi:Gti1/Pac2 family-domain-containing protein [Leptodontidium sp. 2 PMI_412]|nr:Gti1/Pac2 family-domain-containing protein [Leptodontidium sp. 2 PMI_412]
MASASPLSPTFYGHIASTQDALLLFEACLSGTLNHVARRPYDHERVSLIKSGNVFIYEEHSSGIKQWTDGMAWSPSRIFRNFLVYRELERSFSREEKQRALDGYNPVTTAASSFDPQSLNLLSKETKRSLIGDLADSYDFKEDGLVKKSVTITVGGISHYLISYYTVADVMYSKFTTPTKDARFQHITPRPDLITKQNFQTSIHEVDAMDRIDDRSVYASCL